MQKLLDYISEELATIEKKAGSGKLSMQELQYADTLARTKKNLLKCADMGEDAYSNADGTRRYSMRGYSREDADRRSSDSYSNYGPGRGPNASRDRYGRYSTADGYSMRSDDMIDELRELMDRAPDEQKRQEFKRFIEKLERM